MAAAAVMSEKPRRMLKVQLSDDSTKRAEEEFFPSTVGVPELRDGPGRISREKVPQVIPLEAGGEFC